MKTQNTLENKRKFLVHSYVENRNLVKCKDGEGITFGILNIFNNPEDFYAELKSLSSITDEEALYLAELQYSLGEYITIVNGRCMVSCYANQCDLNQKQVDYLRGNGYALPWNDLKIEDLIEYGWVKLKEN